MQDRNRTMHYDYDSMWTFMREFRGKWLVRASLAHCQNTAWNWEYILKSNNDGAQLQTRWKRVVNDKLTSKLEREREQFQDNAAMY